MEAGVDPSSARDAAARSLGNQGQIQEETRMHWTWTWWERFAQDLRYGWRQLMKTKVTSAATILSLALAIGACLAAFRLIDALLLRPLPITAPERLFAALCNGTDKDGKPQSNESFSYTLFLAFREALHGQADTLAVSFADRSDMTFGSDLEMEKAYRQFVSGSLFSSFGLRPAQGRLLNDTDDQQPGTHPYAVISEDFWARRFGKDPRAVGRSFRMGNQIFEIVGVIEGNFTGTEPGTMVDVFLPMMMQNAGVLSNRNAFWLRIFVRPHEGVSIDGFQHKLYARYHQMEKERAKSFVNFPAHLLRDYPKDKLVLQPAASGMSGIQRNNQLGLIALAGLVALVLLIACGNAGNLMTARAAARAKEMALRVSLGAGRGRLVQLVLIESAWIAFLAAGLGALFALWSAPLVVSLINPPDNPARLHLTMDWRVLGFGLAVACGVTLLFGLTPALRASGVSPANALKGSADPRQSRRLMQGLIAAQVAFCAVVLFLGAMFVASYDRLAHEQTGFSSERLLVLEAVTQTPQSPIKWAQLSSQLGALPGIEKSALAQWPLLSGTMSNNFISIQGAPPTDRLTYFLGVSPGWMETMKIPLLEGRDLRPDDVHPGTALVNETFAKTYFSGASPIGKSFAIPRKNGAPIPYQIVGLVGDARYSRMRQPMLPVAYTPLRNVDEKGVEQAISGGSIFVRTSSANPLLLGPALRQQVAAAGSGFRVSNLRTQQELVEMHTVRERLLAMLALFFSVVALVLASVGLYGVLDYSVLQRRREIGIRLAMGAPGSSIVRGVTAGSFAMVIAGLAVGAGLGITAQRYLQELLYGAKAADWGMIGLTAIVLLSAAILAAVPPAIRAVRLDPIQSLRSE